jgi:hypothetical protein
MNYVKGCHCNVCPSCTHRLKNRKGAAKQRELQYRARISLSHQIRHLEKKAKEWENQ